MTIAVRMLVGLLCSEDCGWIKDTPHQFNLTSKYLAHLSKSIISCFDCHWMPSRLTCCTPCFPEKHRLCAGLRALLSTRSHVERMPGRRHGSAAAGPPGRRAAVARPLRGCSGAVAGGRRHRAADYRAGRCMASTATFLIRCC